MKLIYSSTAWLSLDKSIDFLRQQGAPENKIIEIVTEVFEKAESLKQFPHQGQKELMLLPRKKLYRRLIYRFFKIVYYVEDDFVYVIAIFDTRQDPKTLKKLIS